MKLILPLGSDILFVVLIQLFLSTSVMAFGQSSGTDVRSASLGNLHALSKEFVNPAYLSFHSSSRLGVAVSNRFQMSELNICEAYGIFPNRYLDAGIKMSAFGYSEYKNLTGRLGLSKKINTSVSLGAGLNYMYEVGIENVAAHRIKADAGVFFRLSEQAGLALLAKNIAGNDPSDRFALYGGIDYSMFLSCNIMLEASIDQDKIFSLSAGMEYELMEKFFFRAGFQSNPRSPAFGVSYSLEKITVDLCFMNHQLLGNSSSIGVSYQF